MEEFGWKTGTDYAEKCNGQMQKEFNEAPIKVMDNVPHDKEEVISYVYGGG